jgi:hypothetical protein
LPPLPPVEELLPVALPPPAPTVVVTPVVVTLVVVTPVVVTPVVVTPVVVTPVVVTPVVVTPVVVTPVVVGPVVVRPLVAECPVDEPVLVEPLGPLEPAVSEVELPQPVIPIDNWTTSAGSHFVDMQLLLWTPRCGGRFVHRESYCQDLASKRTALTEVVFAHPP